MLVLLTALSGIAVNTPVNAEGFGDDFDLSFAPISGNAAGVRYSCGFAGVGDNGCDEHMAGKSSTDPKPHKGYADGDEWPYFVEEWEDSSGTGYYHQIIGDPAQGWVQEVYIHGPGLNVGSTPGGMRSPSGGSNAARFQPLSHESEDPGTTGNGTGNPTMVAIRMYLKDTDTDGNTVELDFIKDGYYFDGTHKRFDRKPYIQQTITVPGALKTEFEVDMRNISYSDDTSDPQLFVMRQYNMGIADPADPIPEETFAFSTLPSVFTIEPESGAAAYLFDPSIAPPPPPPGGGPAPATGRNLNVTAGKFRWTGTFDKAGGYGDTYIYADGNFDVQAVEWRNFWEGSSEWSQGDPYP